MLPSCASVYRQLSSSNSLTVSIRAAILSRRFRDFREKEISRVLCAAILSRRFSDFRERGMLDSLAAIQRPVSVGLLAAHFFNGGPFRWSTPCGPASFL